MVSPRRPAPAHRAGQGRATGRGGDAAVAAEDSVDRIVADWSAERPDLAVGPIEVITRLSRVRTHIEDALTGTFARYDLTAADFTVIAALRRAGAPYAVAQSALMARLGLTSGTVSVRLARLEAKGIVTRTPSSGDGRSVLVTLTDKGGELFDRVAPDHLAGEDVLLSALTPDERDQLAGLLRTLLISFEHERTASPLGFSVDAAHRARRARTAVGLSDRAGLLVVDVDPHGPAHAAGLHTGDLVTHADERPVHSCLALADATASAGHRGEPLTLQVLRGEQEIVVEVHQPPARDEP